MPYGDYNCLVLPRDAEEKENDYVMLADIFPTGYHATELAGVRPGESVVIYGAGPVGLMAALSAVTKGASQVMVVDTQKDRLALAEKMGAIAIDNTEGDGVEQVMELTGGKGADRGCECVGYQCCNLHREEVPDLTMNNLVQSVKFTGRHRLRRRVRAARPGLRRQARPGRQDAVRLRHVLVQGPEPGHRAVQREGLQPLPQ